MESRARPHRLPRPAAPRDRAGKALSNRRWDNRRKHDDSDQKRELRPVDDVRVQSVQRADRAEGEPGRHEQRRERRVRRREPARERVDAGHLRRQLPGEEQRQDAEVRPERARGDAHPAFEEEERGQEREGYDPQPLLLTAVLDVMTAHDEPEDERGQHRL
jgi:hypothetical protein